jgi:malate dehydrogenase
VEGEYGIDGVYLGVPARIGAGGITEIVELPLTDEELAGLRQAAAAVKEKVDELREIDLA